MDNSNRNLIIIGSIFGIGLFAAIVVGIVLLDNPGKNTQSNSNNSASISPNNSSALNNGGNNSKDISSESSNSSSNTTFKNGTYTSSINYRTHGHMESITVNITLENNVIKSLQDTNSGNESESQMYQDSFESRIQGQVIGKNISQVSISRIGGASDTTDAFMNALQNIETQAQS